MYIKVLENLVKFGNLNLITVYYEEMLNLHHGQGLEIYYRDRFQCPDEDRYLTIVKQKTGGLLRLSIRWMLIYAKLSADESQSIEYPDEGDDTSFHFLVQLAELIGIFFQIRDDYLNLVSKDYHNAKQYCEDITEGKYSFPVIHYFSTASDTKRFLEILKLRTTDVNIKMEAVGLLSQNKSLEYTRTKLLTLKNDILRIIEENGGNPELEKIINALSADLVESE
jgi:geranylgeranyl diphosphate synthase type 3